MKDLNSLRFLSSEMNFVILDNMKFLTCFATNYIYMMFKGKVTVCIYSYQFLVIASFSDGTFDINWNRL